ncbi:hypothetical protein TNCV_3649451 [Trichonephila clavipes]|nr:hypothetical protein TNCV_3649451 [Trichonephila clavipes]
MKSLVYETPVFSVEDLITRTSVTTGRIRNMTRIFKNYPTLSSFYATFRLLADFYIIPISLANGAYGAITGHMARGVDGAIEKEWCRCGTTVKFSCWVVESF